MLFHQLCKEYIDIHKGLFYSFVVISTISYIIKIIVTPLIYSNIMDISDSNFLKIIKQILILWVLIGVVYIVKLKLENQLFPEFLSFVRQRLLRLFLEKNKTNFNDSNVSADITRIFEVTRYMKDVFYWTTQFILPLSLFLICINFYFFYKLPILGALNITCNAIFIGYVYNQYPKLVEKSNQRENTYMDMVKKMDENFNNLFNIYINNQDQEIIKQNEKIENEYMVIYKKQNNEVMMFTNTIKTINYFFAFLCLNVIYLNSKSKFTKKDFVNILLIFTFYIATLENLAEDIPFYVMTMGNIKNAEPFLENTTKIVKKETYLPTFQGNINIDRISFKYKDKPIFEDFSLNIKKGERIGIVGETGKGKSTLMKLILNFYTVHEGTIYLDGHDIKNIDVDDIRKNINYINQKTILFNDTILNNMRYGNSASREEIIGYLKKYDLLRIFHSEENLELMIEKNGTNISMGMQKVIFLIRGLAKKCSVYILDEPFSSIDPHTRKNVLQLINDQTKGKTVIVITHDMDGLENILDEIIKI